MVGRVVFLDTGPLGLATNPQRSNLSADCAKWLLALLNQGQRMVVPEIADYEIRRELLRANKGNGLSRLDKLESLLEYLPITTNAMRRAAELWALARQQGIHTSDDKALDGDVILAAQALTFDTDEFVIATTNLGHLARFATAELWPQITA